VVPSVPVEEVENMAAFEFRSPKDRRPKEGRIPKSERTAFVDLGFRNSAFFRASDFGFRHWVEQLSFMPGD
jgi:hypothetical protein